MTNVPAGAVDRNAEAARATWVSVGVNLVLTVLQLVIGWLGNAQSLIAHGLHSLSDLLSDFLVLLANRQSAQPADADHPYGHARMETAATLVLGTSLVVIGGGILIEAALRLESAVPAAAIEWSAFWVAVLTVVGKEVLYHYLVAVARRLRSPLLTANAMHTRADAASALVVVLGIGGALYGWSFLDLAAAALMGLMILHMGADLAWGALKELVDTGLDAAQTGAIAAALRQTPGVAGLHVLRTRRMAHQVLVDAHIEVDARISVSEGHAIAERARRAVLAAHADVLDVLVHVDPENDLEPPAGVGELPDRARVLDVLRPALDLCAGTPQLTLHYLSGRLELELLLPTPEAEQPAGLAEALASCLQELPAVSALRLFCASTKKVR